MTVDVALSGDLFESFLLDSWDALGQFETATLSLHERYDADTLQQLSVLSHRIKGTTALYGYPQMSRLAELAERLLDLRPELSPVEREGLIAFLERLVLCLRSALERVSARQPEGELGLEFAEIGGTTLLKNLLKSNPKAFVRRHNGIDRDRGAVGDLNHQLTSFFRENADVWEYFAPEAREHIEAMRAILESHAPTEEDLTSLFRSAHTLKGSSYMVGFEPLGDLGHLMEDAMVAVREERMAFDSGVAMVLGEGVDLAERMLRVAEGEPTDLTRVNRHTRRKLTQLLGEDAPDELLDAQANLEAEAKATQANVAPAPVTPPKAHVRVSTDKLDTLMTLVGEVVVARQRLNYELMQLGDVTVQLQLAQARMMRTAREFEEKYLNPLLQQQQPVQATGTAERKTGLSASIQETFAELEFDSYNDLNIVARSVTEISADLNELQTQIERQLLDLRDESETLGKLTHSLRNEVSRARRVPFGQALTRLKRWARGRDGEKPFQLDLSGDTVEVDTFVLEAVVDPLLHLLNNAFIHGLESAEERERIGKPREGRIQVRAFQQGAYLEIEVQDDGGGIDAAAVRSKARGHLPQPDLDAMSDDEAVNLIFLPGLSTAKQVTSDAGRGVGMDVVANNVRRLGGEVLVRTTRGVGTTFTLRVPLTQQITDTLLFTVGDLVAGFATAHVRALRTLPPNRATVTDGGEVVEVDGEFMRLFRLRDLWGYPQSDATELNVIVLQAGGRRLAVTVDEFLGLEEVTVRQNGTLLQRLEYLSGATLSSSGRTVLLLDPQGIEALGEHKGGVRKRIPTFASIQRRSRMLLVDDSVSVRRVVSRMLERAGYVVVTASDGYDALELLRNDSDFDVILTDLEMPRVSGYELLEEVRRRFETADIPVIVMTTRAGEKHQQLAFELGATDYFSKPVDEARLVRRLAEITAGVRHQA